MRPFKHLITTTDHHRLMAAASKPVIVGQLEAADFYLSKVLTKARDAESPAKENLRAYVKTLKAMLTDMGEYGQNFHKQGITWKFGVRVSFFLSTKFVSDVI